MKLREFQRSQVVAAATVFRTVPGCVRRFWAHWCYCSSMTVGMRLALVSNDGWVQPRSTRWKNFVQNIKILFWLWRKHCCQTPFFNITFNASCSPTKTTRVCSIHFDILFHSLWKLLRHTVLTNCNTRITTLQ